MPNPPRLQPGDEVAAKPGKVAGADPFTRLRVTGINDDGTVRVANADHPEVVWKRVQRRHLVPLAPTNP